MTSCKCDDPHEYRATSENGDEDYLYLRCGHCGGKAGRVPIDIEALKETVTDPSDLPPTRESAKTIESGRSVTIQFDSNDSPWVH